MKDKLEDFIYKNRVDFDDLEPRVDLWDGIANQLDKDQISKKRTPKYSWILSIAASIALMIAVLWVFKDGSYTQLQVATDTNDHSTGARQELVEVERYYAGLIDEKKANIRFIVNNNNEVDSQILEDLDDLDRLYVELKDDLNMSGDNDRVINAMIQNLQLRVEILNKQLMILEQISKYEENEKIAI